MSQTKADASIEVDANVVDAIAALARAAKSEDVLIVDTPDGVKVPIVLKQCGPDRYEPIDINALAEPWRTAPRRRTCNFSSR